MSSYQAMRRVNTTNFALAVRVEVTPNSFAVLRVNKALHDLLQVITVKRVSVEAQIKGAH
jgi:hypothetical protein